MSYFITQRQIEELVKQIFEGNIIKFLEDYDFFVPLGDIFFNSFVLQKENYRIQVMFHENYIEILKLNFYADDELIQRIEVDNGLDMTPVLKKVRFWQ